MKRRVACTHPKPFNSYATTTTICVFLSLYFAVIVLQVSQLAPLEDKEHMFLLKEVTPGKTEKVDLISQSYVHKNLY